MNGGSTCVVKNNAQNYTKKNVRTSKNIQSTTTTYVEQREYLRRPVGYAFWNERTNLWHKP
jgi:hypothetical protein